VFVIGYTFHMKTCAILFCFALSGASLAVEEQPIQNPSALHQSQVGRPIPVVELPADVPTPEGKLTLWADYHSATPTAVPLYLVNRTNEDISLDSQDHDLYIKLEYRDGKTGAWKRAQAHLSSWCGNSYYSVSLPARQYFAFHGYLAAEGEKMTVRYAKADGTLVSNEGSGLISKADLDAVAVDSMTAREVPWELTRLLEYDDKPGMAASVTLPQRISAVRSLRWYPQNEPVRKAVLKLQARLIPTPKNPERDELMEAIEDYLARFDEPKPDAVELNEICIARIRGDADASKSMPEEVAWKLLKVPGRDGALDKRFSDPEIWRPLIAPAVARLKLRIHEIGFGADHAILSTGWIVDAVVKNAEIESWVAEGSPRLREIGAVALVRRSSAAKLVELAWKLPPEEQLNVLKALAAASGRVGARQPDYGSGEDQFWTHCASTMPLETAGALFSYDYVDGHNPYNRLIHDPLREFFKKEAANGRQEKMLIPQDDQRLRTALMMLASWKLEEDDALMRELLEHGGHTLQTSWQGDLFDEVVTKRYTLRFTAKQALLKRGVPVPGDVVIETEISRTPRKKDR
jgi:hypothetical protein